MKFPRNLKYLIIVFSCAVCFVLYCCKSIHLENSKSEQDYVKNNGENELIYTIIPFDKKKMYYLGFESPSEFSDQELIKIDSLLNNYLNQYNSTIRNNIFEANKNSNRNYNLKAKDHVLELSNYKRQYIPALNSYGEKVVWINCFCDQNNYQDWKEKIVSVKDGGNCYFELKINLDTGEIYEHRVNGVA